MRALIDTHTFLWMAADQSQLSGPVLGLLNDASHEFLFSLASAWELAIKVRRGRLQLQVPFVELIEEVPKKLGLSVLPIRADHLVKVAGLPEHHKDPFDRLLVAQALVEQVPLLSTDGALDAYGVQRIW